MSVTVRPYRRGGWEVDIRVVLPDDSEHRQRRRAPVSAKSAAQRWGEDRERVWYHDLTHSPKNAQEPTDPKKEEPTKQVPTLQEFAPRFLDGHTRAERQKPSGIAATETIIRVHLVPRLGGKRLDMIVSEDVQRLKSNLQNKEPKTVNNVLTVLSTLLKKAVEWGAIAAMPCTIRLLRAPKSSASFHDFEAYERLVTTAHATDPRAYVIVLLGGDAGLRCGEIMALTWTDVDLNKRQLCIQRSDWKGHVTSTKSGRLRYVPMTVRLATALQNHRHLRHARVICSDDGGPSRQRLVQGLVARAARRANLATVGVHVLRHTFCSHLTMRGAPARAIQELAGHQDLGTTQRYMHLSPAALDAAIRLLDGRSTDRSFGDIVEMGSAISESVKN
jgi:integrase